jgi:hypothetical protein
LQLLMPAARMMYSSAHVIARFWLGLSGSCYFAACHCACCCRVRAAAAPRPVSR